MSRLHWKSLAILAAAVLPTGPILAQVTKPADPMAPLPDANQLPPPATQAEPATPAPTPPPPPPLWRVDQAQTLLAYINAIGGEGLNPADYDPASLVAAIRGGDPAVLAQVATDHFNQVSSDLAFGHVRGDARIDWHVRDRDLDKDRQRQLLDAALRDNRIADALNGLLPTHPQYGALKHALTVVDPAAVSKVNRIKLNMDRWRWLPRDLGQKYIIVNVPAYHATLVENGATRWKHRAIAGAIKTPTPQLNAMATGVILNPWWEVPPSISKEVVGKPGYVSVKGKDGKIQRWRQPPGPSNALGQLKFVMPNEFAIYLHDTNARSRFNANVRALSHGCIRTEHVVDLATELLGDDAGAWDEQKMADTLASKKTVQANFVKPVPVYIVYFSSAALTDGTIVDYDDVYKRDGKVITALLTKSGTAPAAVAADKATKSGATPTKAPTAAAKKS